MQVESEDETPLFSSGSSSASEQDDEMMGAAGPSAKVTSIDVGRQLLMKMGWKEGSGLGLSGNGIVNPIVISEKRGSDLTGIGKSSLDSRTIDSTTSKRRELQSERLLNETDEDRIRREALVETRQAQKDQVSLALQTYKCDICQKQYDRPSAYETHLTSYDHHHKKVSTWEVGELASATVPLKCGHSTSDSWR